MDAISAMESTHMNMPKQTAKKTQIAPAGPPFVKERVPVLSKQSMVVSK
jgi:hypothetical protein